MSDDEIGRLVRAAAGGDQAAWDALVAEFSGMLWGIARSFRLDSADAGDVVQTTWLKLVENLGRITEPERLPGWLATTARRECLRLIRIGGREGPRSDETWAQELVADTAPIDAALLENERDAALWRALARLGDRCRQLLRVLMATPPPPYKMVAVALDMPVGSIGPRRGQCLDQLRRIVAGDDVLSYGAGDGR